MIEACDAARGTGKVSRETASFQRGCGRCLVKLTGSEGRKKSCFFTCTTCRWWREVVLPHASESKWRNWKLTEVVKHRGTTPCSKGVGLQGFEACGQLERSNTCLPCLSNLLRHLLLVTLGNFQGRPERPLV